MQHKQMFLMLPPLLLILFMAINASAAGSFVGVHVVNGSEVDNTSEISLGQTYDSSNVNYVLFGGNAVGINVFNESGVPGTIYTNGTLATLDNSIESDVLTAGQLSNLGDLTIDTEAKTITQEFIVRNNQNVSDSVYELDAFDNIDHDWSSLGITNPTITGGAGYLKVTGTGGSDGRFRIWKDFGTHFDEYDFIRFTLIANRSCSAFFILHDISSNKEITWNNAKFAIAANTSTTFVLPINAPLSASATNLVYPTAKSSSCNLSNETRIYIGLANTGTSVDSEVYLDNLMLQNTQAQLIEMQTPDDLAATSLKLEAWNSSAYNIFWEASLDNGYTEVTKNSDNITFGDGSKQTDCYIITDDIGFTLYPKGNMGSIVEGSDSTDLTYANESTGALDKIGAVIKLPPCDNGRTDFDQIQLRATLYTDNLNTTFTANNTTLMETSYINANKLTSYFDEDSIYDTRCTFATTNNDTYTAWHNSSSSQIQLAHSTSDADISSIRVSLPKFLTVNNVRLNDTSLIYSPNIEIGYSQSIADPVETILPVDNSDVYNCVIAIIPSYNFTSGTITYQSDNTALIGSQNQGTPTVNNSASVSYVEAIHTFMIETSALVANTQYTYNVSMAISDETVTPIVNATGVIISAQNTHSLYSVSESATNVTLIATSSLYGSISGIIGNGYRFMSLVILALAVAALLRYLGYL